MKKLQAVRAGAGSDITSSYKTDKKLTEGEDATPEMPSDMGDITFDAGGAIPTTIKAIGDPRELETAMKLKKTQLRAAGLNMSHEPEGDMVEAMSSYDRNRKAAAKRAAQRNAERRAGKRGGRMERETYRTEMGVNMHHKGYKAEAYTVNQADKTGNTPAYQGYKAGKKNKLTGEPLYKKSNTMKESKVKMKVKPKYGKGEKIGRVVGGIGGSVAGGIGGASAGTAVAPGVGSVAGGVAGSGAGDVAGTKVGGKIGKTIDKVAGKLKGKKMKKEDLDNVSKFNVDGNSYRSEKDAINEILGATIGGSVGGKLAGDALIKKGMGKVAGRAIGAGVGAAGGEMLDPFKKGVDKSPLTAGIVGGAIGAASPRIAKGFKKVKTDMAVKTPTPPIKDPMKTDFNTSPNKNIA